MITIGIRVSPTEVTYVIYNSAENIILNIEELSIPNALTTPEKLKFIRLNLLDIIREFDVENAGIRLTEPTAQRINIERVQIEAVIQEAFASSNLKKYFYGAINSIAAKNNLNRTEVRPLISGESTFDAVENWDELSEKEREAVLTAMGAVNA